MQLHRSRVALDGWVFDVDIVDGETVTVYRFTGDGFDQRTITLTEAEAHCLMRPVVIFGGSRRRPARSTVDHLLRLRCSAAR